MKIAERTMQAACRPYRVTQGDDALAHTVMVRPDHGARERGQQSANEGV